MKEGGGGDYVQVAWRKSTVTTPAGSLTPIGTANIGTYAATGGGGTGGGTLSISGGAGGVTVTFTGAIQSSDKVNGPWVDETGTSPKTVTPTGTARFYRNKP